MKKILLSLLIFCSVISQAQIQIPQVVGLPSALNSKVDKVTGKSLVADTSIVKLTGIQAGAQVNKIEGVQKNGVDLPITGKKVNITVPTTAAEIGAQPAGTYATGTGTAYNSNTGDETLTSIKTKLGAATSVSDGYLKYQDFVNFESLGFSIIDANKPFRFWQGAGVFNDKIYTFTDRDENFGLKNIIQTYDMNGELLSEKPNAYTGVDSNGNFMSFGSTPLFKNGNMLISVYNGNVESVLPANYMSRIIEVNATTLNFVSEHELGSNIAEGITEYNGNYYVCYHDTMVIREYSSSFSFLREFNLSTLKLPEGGYQSIGVLDGYFYLNYHGSNEYSGNYSPGMDKFSFDGNAFTFIERIKPPTYGSGQGVYFYNDSVYWTDRTANKIIITKSVNANIGIGNVRNANANNLYITGTFLKKTTDLVTNLNADLLDGHHESALNVSNSANFGGLSIDKFVHGTNSIATNASNGIDINTITPSAAFYTGYNNSNTPNSNTADYGYLNIPLWSGLSGSDKSSIQIGGTYGYGTARIRVIGATGAGNWYNIYHSGNLTNTLSTNYIPKWNGSTFVNAIAGTDYQLPITLTTNGTSGAATFSGGNLNIPNYGSSVVNQTQTTINGSVNGNAICSMPFQTSTYKKVIILLGSFSGSLTYAFPTPFLFSPNIYTGAPGIAPVTYSITTTSITLSGGSNTNGWVTLEGF